MPPEAPPADQTPVTDSALVCYTSAEPPKSETKSLQSVYWTAERLRWLARTVVPGGILVGLGLFISRLFPPGPSWLLATGITLALAIGWWWRGRVRMEERARAQALIDACKPRAGATPEPRVLCRGTPTQLARLARLGLPNPDSVGTVFEPQVFLAVASVAPPARRKAVIITVTIMVMAVFGIIGWRAGKRFPFNYGEVILALGVGTAAGAAVFPTYLRVVPGRLDIMECGLLGQRIIQVQRVNLRTDPVRVHLPWRLVAVYAAGAEKPISVAYGALWHSTAFAKAVLDAAVSTCDPPPLPDDALVG